MEGFFIENFQVETIMSKKGKWGQDLVQRLVLEEERYVLVKRKRGNEGNDEKNKGKNEGRNDEEERGGNAPSNRSKI